MRKQQSFPMARGDRVENAKFPPLIKEGKIRRVGKRLNREQMLNNSIMPSPTFTAKHNIRMHFDSKHDENST